MAREGWIFEAFGTAGGVFSFLYAFGSATAWRASVVGSDCADTNIDNCDEQADAKYVAMLLMKALVVVKVRYKAKRLAYYEDELIPGCGGPPHDCWMGLLLGLMGIISVCALYLMRHSIGFSAVIILAFAGSATTVMWGIVELCRRAISLSDLAARMYLMGATIGALNSVICMIVSVSILSVNGLSPLEDGDFAAAITLESLAQAPTFVLSVLCNYRGNVVEGEDELSATQMANWQKPVKSKPLHKTNAAQWQQPKHTLDLTSPWDIQDDDDCGSQGGQAAQKTVLDDDSLFA